MNKQEAMERIASLIKEAQGKMIEATEIANKNGVSFSFDGPTGYIYGMGGWFNPTVTKKTTDGQSWAHFGCSQDEPELPAGQEWDDSGCSFDYEVEGGWQASSSLC